MIFLETKGPKLKSMPAIMLAFYARFVFIQMYFVNARENSLKAIVDKGRTTSWRLT